MYIFIMMCYVTPYKRVCYGVLPIYIYTHNLSLTLDFRVRLISNLFFLKLLISNLKPFETRYVILGNVVRLGART